MKRPRLFVDQMVDVIVRKTEQLSGEVYAPPSKAYTQRMLVAALLSCGISTLSSPLVSDDTQTTLRAVIAFGAKIKVEEGCWAIKGPKKLKTPENSVNCEESGATLRFMIPVAALSSDSSIFTLGSSLRRRPIKPLLKSLKQLGVKSNFQTDKVGSFVSVQGGGIKGGKTTIRGDISSQFISGLLFACPMATEDTEIAIITPLESKAYVQMTMEILSKHGIRVLASEDFAQLQIPSKQAFTSCSHQVPGDFSSAAFLLAAAAVTPSKVQVKGLEYRTMQGDKAIVGILQEMGSKVKVSDGQVELEKEADLLNSTDVDARDIPDLVPVCAVLACYSKGISKIYNARRLRYKESDRLMSLCVELRKMGAHITMKKDSLTIKGPCSLRGNTINSHNDHRIAMACTVAALGASGETKIQGSECVTKSYPKFFDDLHSLGADVVDGQFNR